ncbi:SH3 domain-containing protein [uncultured Gilliamella sp.]|uniref:SH3 domain-containing protein n=2 Tax=Gilliamella TaxID=1193503 RepID=UPI0025EC1003|nr:SH3 domain-containing protein [uncultured Gilliamella sp.]
MALTPIKKWKYPIVVNEKNQSGTNRYHEALMLAQTGFYPVSVNKLVHGGIHFDANVLGNLGVVVDKPSKVHCIADGEVIAYRVNDNYQKLDYGDKVGFYSTGFVLVRHLLEMERIEEATPATTPATTEGQASTEADANNSTENSTAPAANALPSSNTAPATTTPATTESTTTQTTGTDTNTPTTPTTTGESSTASTPPATETAKPKQPGHRLYFYSLYMHLADTKFYDDNPTEPAPAFWEQDIYRVIDKGLDFVEGLNIRKSPDSKKGEILAVLQAGTKVELHLDLHTEDYDWYAVKSFTEGYSSIPPLTPYKHEGKEILGWVFNHTKIQLTESVFDIKGEDSKLAKSKGLRVRDESKKNILSMLPKGSQIKISGTKKPKTFVELAEIVRDGKPTIPLQEGKKMVWYDSLENVIRGKKYNEVVVLDKPYPIKAGDLVGHIGHNQNKGISKQKDKDGNYIEMATLPLKTGLTASQYKPSLHVECFTCEDLPTFITQTQTEASKIPDEDKTLVGICKGAKLLASPSKSDTTVGQVLKDTKIKVLSKQVNINWLQIEINTSETETKRLWVENSEKIAEKAKLEGDIELAEATPAWSQHPLQQSELTGSQNVVQMPMILSLNDEAYQAKQTRAVDDKGTLWILIQKDALGSKNLPVLGWAAIGSEGVKNVSCWDWFDFKEIIETSSLKEFYLSAKKAETRNKDNASLEQYKPTIKATLTILDKQYTNNECAALTTDCFNKISQKPALTTALGRLLVNYQSEWYAELNTEGKRPEWEELNSEMTDDAENYLGYIKNGDEAKRDAYVSKQDESKQESIKQGLEQQRKDYQRFPPDYKDAPDKKLTSEQLRLYGKIQELEKKLIIWENTKEKATKMLWWDDVAKGLAKQSQQTKQSNTEKDKTEDSSKQQAETSSTPANLSQNGRAWFMHPIGIQIFNFENCMCNKCITEDQFRSILPLDVLKKWAIL